MGDPQAAVRLAGVYAMAHLADEWAEQRQQCVDVLCAYLRLPWAGDSTQLEPNTTTTEHTWPDGEGQRKVTKTYSGRAGEREVRQTLIRVIAAHLWPGTDGSTRAGVSWSDLDIDLTNAALPNADFSHAHFRGKTSFQRATFSGAASFGGAQFSGTPDFFGAQFSGGALFLAAQFSRGALFGQAEFAAGAAFDGAKFLGPASFSRAQFSSDASFAGVQFFGSAVFHEAQFSGDASFGGAEFTGLVDFSAASLPSRSVFASARVRLPSEALNEAAFTDEQPGSSVESSPVP